MPNGFPDNFKYSYFNMQRQILLSEILKFPYSS